MPIYKDKVQVLLNATVNKNAADLVERKVWLPSIGIATDVTVVQIWLDKVKTVLQNVLTLQNDREITVLTSPLLNGLCQSCRSYIDNILEASECTADYERIRILRLYKFAVTP